MGGIGGILNELIRIKASEIPYLPIKFDDEIWFLKIIYILLALNIYIKPYLWFAIFYKILLKKYYFIYILLISLLFILNIFL